MFNCHHVMGEGVGNGGLNDSMGDIKFKPIPLSS